MDRRVTHLSGLSHVPGVPHLHIKVPKSEGLSDHTNLTRVIPGYNCVKIQYTPKQIYVGACPLHVLIWKGDTPHREELLTLAQALLNVRLSDFKTFEATFVSSKLPGNILINVMLQ